LFPECEKAIFIPNYQYFICEKDTMNTGYQQAVIALCVSRPGGQALDVDGNLCSESGKRQAIMLLRGEANPSPEHYEVYKTFEAGEVIDGCESRRYNAEACPLPTAKPETPPVAPPAGEHPALQLPDYVKPEPASVYLETAARYQTGGNDYDTPPQQWKYANGTPIRGTYRTQRIGEYEWLAQNVRMHPSLSAGRAWAQYANTQEIIDNYTLNGGYGSMSLRQSEEYEGGWFPADGLTDEFFDATAFYADSSKSVRIDGWKRPSLSDWAQLLAMSDTLDYEGVIRFLGVEANSTEYPFGHDWAGIAANTSGFAGIPAGSRQNAEGFLYRNPRRSMAFKMDYAQGSLLRIEPAQTGVPVNIFADNLSNINSLYPGNSIKFYLASVRYCRPLSDSELGYKLYQDTANDKVIVTAHDAPAPGSLPELPKGRLRARAVRWLNADKTQVLAPLSQLLTEIAETTTGGKFRWLGFDEG
jgi:uncharacterized protein (TIGR02145 family)